MPLYNPGIPAGCIMGWGGPDRIVGTNSQFIPKGWLVCDGQTYSRTTYSALFSAIVPLLSTFTVTIASPGVLTIAASGIAANLQTGDQVYLTTTGALPTGLTANTLYYVILVSSTTIELATSRANAYAATAINTSGSQSGTHSIYYCPYGLGDGSTTFTIPDMRGRVPAGSDQNTTRLNLSTTQGSYGNIGATGGEQSHALTTAEGPSHTHVLNKASTAGGDGSGYAWSSTTTSNSTGVATSGSNTAHNNVQPTVVINYIIKY